MTRIAPKSSMTAKAVKKIFKDVGTRLPKRDKIPIANAISVAIGIPAPFCVGVPKLNAKNSPAGISIPPSAPKTGKAAFLMLDNSPPYNSRSNSNPMSKKKIVMSPSLIQWVME